MPYAHVPEGARRSGGSGDLRHGNLTHILSYVRDHGPCSRHDIAEGCGLGISTLTDLVGELRSRALVKELDPIRRPGAGRPTRPIDLDGEPWIALGLHIDLDKIRVTALTVGGRELWADSTSVSLRAADEARITSVLSDLLREQVDRLPSGSELVSVEAGLPGFVARDRGLVSLSNALEWQDLQLRDLVRQAVLDQGVTGAHVGIANDCHLAALHAVRKEVSLPPDVVAVYFGGMRGLGSGVIIDGQMFGGADGAAGDLAHANVRGNTERCWCGRQGCLECVLHPAALLARAGVLPAEQADALVQERPHDAVRQLVERAEAGDDQVLGTLRDAGLALGSVIDDVLGLLNPHAAILGGYVGVLSPYLMTAIDEQIVNRMATSAFSGSKVVALDTVVPRVVRGAALAAQDACLAHPLTLTRPLS